jgi:hypothetical protein
MIISPAIREAEPTIEKGTPKPRMKRAAINMCAARNSIVRLEVDNQIRLTILSSSLENSTDDHEGTSKDDLCEKLEINRWKKRNGIQIPGVHVCLRPEVREEENRLRQENISLSLIQAGSVPASDKLRSFISVVDSGQNNYLHLFHEFVA